MGNGFKVIYDVHINNIKKGLYVMITMSLMMIRILIRSLNVFLKERSLKILDAHCTSVMY